MWSENEIELLLNIFVEVDEEDVPFLLTPAKSPAGKFKPELF